MDTAALTNRSSTCSPNALSLYTKCREKIKRLREQSQTSLKAATRGSRDKRRRGSSNIQAQSAFFPLLFDIVFIAACMCVCLCACNTYVCNALARHNNIRTISHELDLYGAGVLTAHAGRIHFMGDKKYYSPQLFIQILMKGFFKFLYCSNHVHCA